MHQYRKYDTLLLLCKYIMLWHASSLMGFYFYVGVYRAKVKASKILQSAQ